MLGVVLWDLEEADKGVKLRDKFALSYGICDSFHLKSGSENNTNTVAVISKRRSERNVNLGVTTS